MKDLNVEITANDFRFNPPAFSDDELAAILEREFGITGAMKRLEGERDQNTRITTADGSRYVFKISSPDETEAAVDFQVSALEHVRKTDPGLDVPVHIPARNGQLVTSTADSKDLSHHVRLLTFVAGTPMLYAPLPGMAGVRKIGALVGRLSHALSDFEHPAAEHFMPWDLMNGIVVNQRLLEAYLPRALHDDCDGIIQRLASSSLPRMDKLPSQVIHSDVHAANLLTDPDNPDEVHGIIDFGDLVKRPLVVDLAAALASLIEHYPDTVGVSRQFVAGFKASCELADEQLDLLYDAICARQILTVLLFNFRLAEVGYDADIVNTYLPNSLQGMRKLLAVEHDEFRDALFETGA